MAYYPPNGSYAEVIMNENVYLDYPYSSDISKTTVQDLMGINANAAALSLILPDATETGPGFSIAFSNIGFNAVSIKLNNGIIELVNLAVGASLAITLSDSTTANGTWLILPLGNGVPAISTFTVNSPNSSIDVTNGTVITPSGTVSLDVSNLLNRINDLQSVSAGIVVLNNNEIEPWYIAIMAGDGNITVTNGNGASFGDPIVINLNNTIEIDQVTAGNIAISGNEVSNTANNTDMNVNTTGTSYLILNGVKIDTSGNISNIASLSATTAFIGPNIPKAWCRFTNTSGTIVLTASYNVTSITYNNLNYQYSINFTTPMGTTEYGVTISCANNNSTSLPIGTRVGYDVVRTEDYVNIVFANLSGEVLEDFPEGVTVTIYSLI
jgi:hypothetical protein